MALAATLLMVGCGQESAADKDEAALERAAGQSTPEAADILRNADPGANVQEVLQNAGNAQAATEAPPPKVPAGGNGQ